ncbi:50S ribosomal protein L11 methyltransferase [Peptostreptococcus canis]|uniref:Ribosomal protein L11 methyltransferase n=1 Tax=Peptostreptococcus canis TaxID=1159213 RepID=A0ABR6TMX7_9FIRM|nr:50S ribosomal protein L11 methyltransferase [Peptostreptococcus canis]MBC2576519.1 50S ribosomal protein L11 methyltransferase [Peptostreptococcus canis]MBP1998645.1 ribosomal protein L11 methyltransferase [Peptostreptococcus canis]
MSDTWIEVTIKTTTEAVEAITNILYENGAQGAMIEDPKDFYFQKKNEYDWDYVEEEVFKLDPENENIVIIKTYISEEKNVLKFMENIRIRINELSEFGIDIGKGEISTESVKEEDWANNWKQYYKPTKIGNNIVIKPEWEEYSPREDDIIIEMNPGMAFGTGNHETTNMCVSNLEKFVKKDSTVFDIGCGSGILGITAAKLGAKEVLGIDIDEVAVKVANENIQKNNVQSVMKAIQGNLADDIDKNKKPDIVVANIIADIIIILAKDVKEFLKKDGIFISSGIIHAKIHEVVDALEQNGFNILEVQKKGEWACIIASC